MRMLNHTLGHRGALSPVSLYLEDFSVMLQRFTNTTEGIKVLRNEIQNKIEEMNKKLKEVSEWQNLMAKKRNELNLNNEKIEVLRKDRKTKVPDNNIKNIDNIIKEKKSDVSKIDNDINKLTTDIKSVEDDIKEKTNKIEETTKNIERWKIENDNFKNIKFDLDSLNKEIEERKDDRIQNQAKFDIYYQVQQMLEKEKIEETVCPLCEIGKITAKKIKDLLKNYDSQIRELDKKISELIEQKNHFSQISNNIKKNDENISRGTDIIKENIQDRENRENELKSYQEEIKQKQGKTKKIKDEIDYYMLQMVKGLPEQEKELRELQKRNKELETEIDDLFGKNKFATIDVFGKKFQVNKETQKTIEKIFAETLSDLENHYQKLKKIEEKKLIEEFNKGIKGIINELKFNLDIYIDTNFNILARKKAENKLIALETQNLSRSEQATIALLLQLALATEYEYEIPIILIDGIFEYFDEERRDKVIKYLDEFGKRHNKAIVMTIVKNGLNKPEVVFV
jgi:DNA repair exonuclease SbcCD ATPase subunit